MRESLSSSLKEDPNIYKIFTSSPSTLLLHMKEKRAFVLKLVVEKANTAVEGSLARFLVNL